MTQLELPLNSPFTLAAFLDMGARFEASNRHKLERVSMPSERFAELYDSLPLGFAWAPVKVLDHETSSLILNGVEIEVYGYPED